MISSTFGGYMIAKLGLSAAQQGLYLTGQNLTNAGTEGYTRQRLDQVSINYGSTYRYASKYEPNIGNGVLVKGTSQLRDPFLDLRYRNEVSHEMEQEVKLDILNDLRDILDEVKLSGEDSLGDGGIFNQLGDIIEKFQKYSSEIGSKEFDSMVKASCQSLVTLFNAYSNRIQSVKNDLIYDLENVDVPAVNQILTSIQELNKTIKSSEIIGMSALELKDERNLLIDKLSEYMKINVTYKPINVTDTTVVDELHISLVGQDGNNYEIIADEQRREFILEMDGEKANLGLGALSPVDMELKAELKSAEIQLSAAQKKYDNRNQAYADEHNNFIGVREEWEKRNETLEKLKGELEPLKEAMTEAANKYRDKLFELGKIEDPAEKEAAKAELKALGEERDNAVNAYNTKNGEVRSAQAAVDNYKSIYGKAETAYTKALDNLDVNPDTTQPPLQGLKNLLTGGELHGKGLAESALNDAKTRVTKALDALAQSEENGKAVGSVNELLTDGKLKGQLDMLNYSAEYDDPPNTMRGIGYYQQMLDTLANKFAESMNAANNPFERTELVTDKDGHVVYENYEYDAAKADYVPKKENGKYVYGKDSAGNDLYMKDKNGQVVYDEDGVPMPMKIAETKVTNDIRDLFKSRDGDKITAGNIDLADGWVDNSYGITTALNADDPSGNNTNVLHFINMLNGKLNYKADVSLMDQITINFDTAGAGTSANEPSIAGMKKGDTITIDGKTYTFTPGATGQSGNEFKDFDTLKIAAAKNGIDLAQDANGKITATTAAQDLRGETTINGEPYSNVKGINVNNLSYGDTIVIDGKTFTYKPEAYPDGTAVADPAKGEFTSLEDLVQVAAKENITISTQVTSVSTKNAKGETEQITSIGVNGTDTELSKFDAASLNDGDKVTINGKTYTYANPAKPQPAAGEFSSMDDLMALAGQDGVTIATNVAAIQRNPGATLDVAVDKSPSIDNLETGNTVTIGNQKNADGTTGTTFTYVNPKEVDDIVTAGAGDITIGGQTFTYVKPDDTATPPVVADPAKGEFSDMDSLIAAAAAANPAINLFSNADNLKSAAAEKGITLYVDPETNEITTATKPGSNIFDGSFEEYYVSLSATLGLDIKSTTEKADSFATLAGSIYDEREAVTGVSHDEEAMNLMRYQQSYTAASRLMTVLDEVLNILLTQTGVAGR